MLKSRFSLSRPVPRPPPLLEQFAAGAFCLRSVDRAADPPAGAELFQGTQQLMADECGRDGADMHREYTGW